MDGIRGSTLKRAWVAWPGLVAAPHVLFWASWPTSLTYCALEGSRDKILTPEKFQVNLSSGRFSEHQNTQNRLFWSKFGQNSASKWVFLVKVWSTMLCMF
jgi:hypothetical protein